MLRFKVSKREAALIDRIVDRAVAAAGEVGINYKIVDARMDITACHASGNRLDLNALLAADDFNFSHDVFGIRRHLNRQTGRLEGFFTPRFAVK